MTDSASILRGVIAAHAKLPVDVQSLSDTDDLYAAGMTSFASVQVMLAVEEAFDIEFPERMLNRRSFSSIAAMDAAVREILSGSVNAA